MIFSVARMNAAPSNSNTKETVVEVGMPSVLNTSSTMTSVTITARKMVITSLKEKLEGFMMPWRATSIMPEDITAPTSTPHEAMISTVRNLATRAPTADCKKLTASLLTPTNKSNTAKHSRKTTIHK